MDYPAGEALFGRVVPVGYKLNRMARPRANPPSPPAFLPEKSIPILENLVIEAEKLHSEPWDSPEREMWINTGEGALIAALGQDNPTVDAFGTAQTGFSSIYDRPEVRLRRANDQLDRMIAVLEVLSSSFAGCFPIRLRYSFPLVLRTMPMLRSVRSWLRSPAR